MGNGTVVKGLRQRMAGVELLVGAGVEPDIAGAPDIRDALVASGRRVLGPDDGSQDPDTTVVVGDLHRAGELIGRHAGRSRRLVIVQGSHFPSVSRARSEDRRSGSGVVFCVWGAAARDELQHRFPDARIVVTGLPRRDDELARRIPHDSPPGIPRDGEVAMLVPSLTAPIPQALRAVSERLLPLIGRAPRWITPGDLARREEGPSMLIGSDASLYRATVAAGVPLIVVDELNGERQLPRISHHLLASATDADHAEELVVCALLTGRFWGNSAGELLERFVAGVGGAERVVQAAAGGPAGPLESWNRRVAVVSVNFGRDVGLAIPVMTLAGSLVTSGRGGFRYFDARAFTTDAQYRAWIPPDDVVLVNGLETLTTAPALRRFVQSRLDAGTPAFVYVHLTEAGLERERLRRPGELEAALRLLRRCPVLCVSEYQQRLFRGLGVRHTRVVYNTSPSLAGASETPAASRPLQRNPRIVMVGTMQARKGVDLFSEVADLAAKRHPEWRFQWAGAAPAALPSEVPVSSRVEWLGRLDRDGVRDLLRQADLFFLSSRDDPMPLAVIEAIAAGLRVVSFDRVGAFEILRDADGFAAFSDHTPEAALAALEIAMTSQPDAERWRGALARFTVDAFEERMRAALDVDTAVDAFPAASLPAERPPPSFPVPTALLADTGIPDGLRAVLRRAAERHAGDRAARVRLADRLLTAGDPRAARDVLAAAGVHGVPHDPDPIRIAAVLRRESGSRAQLMRIAAALRRRSSAWSRRIRRPPGSR